jgi:hypothetical protein
MSMCVRSRGRQSPNSFPVLPPLRLQQPLSLSLFTPFLPDNATVRASAVTLLPSTSSSSAPSPSTHMAPVSHLRPLANSAVRERGREMRSAEVMPRHLDRSRTDKDGASLESFSMSDARAHSHLPMNNRINHHAPVESPHPCCSCYQHFGWCPAACMHGHGRSESAP